MDATTRRPGPRLDAVRTWIFDLDNTLYPPSARLLDQINGRMTAFIARELGLGHRSAERLRTAYWRRHGTTLAGLVRHHRVDPAAFLSEVHAIDLSGLATLPGLADALARLPGRRLVHTNGSRRHARRVLDRLGLALQFERVFGIDDTGFAPKPGSEAYARVMAAGGIDPGGAAMVEDHAANLAEPKRLGMRTVWLTAPGDAARPTPGHVDHRTADLVRFLESCA